MTLGIFFLSPELFKKETPLKFKFHFNCLVLIDLHRNLCFKYVTPMLVLVQIRISQINSVHRRWIQCILAAHNKVSYIRETSNTFTFHNQFTNKYFFYLLWYLLNIVSM